MEKGRVFGQNCTALLAKYDPDTHSLRTYQCSFIEGLNEFSATLPRQGTIVNGRLSEQTTLILRHRTEGKESGSLPTYPTPQASDYIQKKTSKSWKAKGGVNYSLSNPEVTGVTNGQLNPEFLEWLMGYPIGWTELKE